MTPTATATKQDALTKLSALESKWRQAGDEATRLGRELFAKRCRLHGHLDDRGLLDERRRLQHQDPEQFHPDGSPRGPEARRIEKGIDAIGDLSKLAAEVEHARRIKARAKRDVDAFSLEYLDAILEGLGPEAEAVAAEANARAAEFVVALDSYLATHGRINGLVAAAGGDTARVAGLDSAAELKRTAERVDLPPPTIPEEYRS